MELEGKERLGLKQAVAILDKGFVKTKDDALRLCFCGAYA